MNSKQRSIIFIGAVAIALAAQYIIFSKNTAPILEKVEPVSAKYAYITMGNASLTAEVVKTTDEVKLGLSGREGLLPDTGMWFDFGTENLWGIWMKDMKFPIDIVWFDKNLEIITVEKNISPKTFPNIFYPSRDASYVLELPAGTVEKYKIGVGNRAFVR